MAPFTLPFLPWLRRYRGNRPRFRCFYNSLPQKLHTLDAPLVRMWKGIFNALNLTAASISQSRCGLQIYCGNRPRCCCFHNSLPQILHPPGGRLPITWMGIFDPWNPMALSISVYSPWWWRYKCRCD